MATEMIFEPNQNMPNTNQGLTQRGENPVKEYPKPTTDGFAFLTPADEAMKLESKEYENGNEVIRIVLKKGRTAIVRELKGSELEKVTKIATSGGGNPQDDDTYVPALIHVCTIIDGVAVMMEDVNEMKAKDYSAIKLAATRLNFI